MTKNVNPLSPPPSTWRRILRVCIDAGRGFIQDDCYSRASALTFYSLLSIVPVLAILFGIAKGFGFEQALEIDISEHFHQQREIMDRLIAFARSSLLNAQGGVIAGVGVILLLWSVLGLLSNIESTLNAIWKIRLSRTYSRKIIDYLAVMIIAPLFFVTSSSITLFLSTHITRTARESAIFEVISPFLLFILKLFPFFLSAVLFVFIYLFMPNTKVYLRSALLAGIVAGTAFQIWQWVYIHFQLLATSYGAIYGSFAALPLFLIWLQVSWLILLAGAELGFEIENDLFIPYRQLIPLSRKAAALLITFRCIEAFVKGEAPQTDRSLAHELGTSLNPIHDILEILQEAHLLSAVSYHHKTIGYQPARAIESLTFEKVCQAVDHSQDLLASVQQSSVLTKIEEYLKEANQTLEESPQNGSLYKQLGLSHLTPDSSSSLISY